MRRKSRTSRWPQTCVRYTFAFASAVLCHSASAQQSQPDESSQHIEEITVYGRILGYLPGGTATKSEIPTLEIPFTVNAVTRELLELRNVNNVGEAIETVGGVSRTIGFSGNQRFRIRGFQSISVLRDGFRQSVSQPEIDLQAVESIEILKGPASALYGRYEPGGIANFVSKRPQRDFASEVSLVGGSHDFQRAGLDVGGPLNTSSTLLGRLNLAYENAGSFRDYIDNEQVFVSPALEYQPSDSQSLLVRAEYLTRDSAFDRGFGNHAVFLDVPLRTNYGEPFMRVEKNQLTATAVYRQTLSSDWDLSIGVYYSDVDVPEEQFFNFGFPPLNGDTVNRSFVRYEERQKDGTAQLELQGQVHHGAVTHKLLIGAEYSEDKLAYLNGEISYGQSTTLWSPTPTGRPDGYSPVGDSHTDYKSTAVYLQDQVSWQQWRLLLGGRFEETKTYAYSGGYVEPGVSRTDTPFSPRIGMTYLLNEDLSIYSSWSRSFRNEGDAGLLESGLTPKPTRGEQIEAGIKAMMLDGRLETSLSVYRLRKTDAVVGDPNDFNLVIQAGELEVKGVEAEFSARPIPQLTVVASYTYTDSSIAKDSNSFIVDNQLAGVPKHQASLWSSWQFDGALTKLRIGGGVFAASEQAATTGNDFYLPAYTRVDLNVKYTLANNYALQLNLNNITNEDIYITGGFSQFYPQPPRNVRLTLSRRW